MIDQTGLFPTLDQPGSSADKPLPRRPLPAAIEPATPPRSINDFGEKIGGARKDLVAKRESAHWVVADDVTSITEAWPRADIDRSESKESRAFAYALRSQCGRGPSHWREAERWRDQVRGARDLSELYRAGLVTRERVAESVPGKALLAHADVLSSLNEKHWSAVRDVTPYTDGRVSVKAHSVRKTYESASDPAIANDIEALAELRKREHGGVEFGVFRSRNAADKTAWISPINVRGIRGGEMRLAQFDDVASARAYLRDDTKRAKLVERFDQLKQKITLTRDDVRMTANRERVGNDYRRGRDVSPERFQREFGFRGVEFGNWVQQGGAGKERQWLLNTTYDALRDLASVTGLKPHDLSLRGNLALAFGARGHGGKSAAAAHYEPGRKVINLTRDNGPGCLAHEWLHALDDHLRGPSDGRPTPLALHATAFDKVIEAIKKDAPELIQRSLRADAGRKPYWTDVRELAARAFETHVVERLESEGRVNDFLANVRPPESFSEDKAIGVYPYPTQEETAKIAPSFDATLEVAREQLQAPERAIEAAIKTARDRGPEWSM